MPYKNPEDRRLAQARYAKAHPDRIRKVVKNYRAKDPARAKAQKISSNAIMTGKLISQPCEVCGNSKTDGHHDDYSKPLEVRWLCRKHHKEVHRKIDCAAVPEER
jgi:hypothetical protein